MTGSPLKLDEADLTALDADRRDLMLSLARSGAPGDRDRLLFVLTDLCRAAPLSPEARKTLGEAATMLVRRAEHDLRLRLAEQLWDADWAPHDLVRALASDEIDIARHLIASSPVLDEADLLDLLMSATAEHAIEVAGRPHLSARLVQAVLDQGRPEALAALAANDTADADADVMRRMARLAREQAAMRAPLARHPRLGEDAGAVLYAWVGEALRRALSERFDVDAEAFKTAVEAATRDALDAEPAAAFAPEERERAHMDRRLAEKLKAAGQLRPGFLLKALRDGDLTLFRQALATLGDFSDDQVLAAVNAQGPELLALACAAVGVDRGALPTVIAFVRSLSDGRPGRDQEVASLNRVTTLMDRTAAARVFREKTGEAL